MSTTAEIMRESDCPAPAQAEAAGPGPEPEPPVTVIMRRPGWQIVDLGELWRCRELLFFLTWRDVKVRYKQTVLGATWAVLQPLATMVVFSLFLGKVAAKNSSDVPYPLFVLAGLVSWTFFSNAIGSAGQSVVGNQNLVTKVYFPRLFIPMGAVGAGVVDLAINFGLLLVMMLGYGLLPGPGLILAPLLALELMVAALGVGTLLSALTVAYRDFRYVVPFMVQLWMFATPSVYLQTEPGVGSLGRALLPLNPAYGLIANFRVAVLGGVFDYYALIVSGAVSMALLVIGCLYFRRVERGFADII